MTCILPVRGWNVFMLEQGGGGGSWWSTFSLILSSWWSSWSSPASSSSEITWLMCSFTTHHYQISGWIVRIPPPHPRRSCQKCPFCGPNPVNEPNCWGTLLLITSPLHKSRVRTGPGQRRWCRPIRDRQMSGCSQSMVRHRWFRAPGREQSSVESWDENCGLRETRLDRIKNNQSLIQSSR